MTDFISKPRRIRDALVSIISDIQYNGEPAFALVAGDPSTDSDQEPFALVFPGEIASTTQTVGQRDRTVNFGVMVQLNLEDEGRTQARTYDYMYDLTDLVMSAIEEADFHSTLNTVDATLGTWMMDVSRSSFIPTEMKSGAALLCAIDIAITYSVDL